MTVIETLGLSVKEAANALGVHRVALSRFLNGQSTLSPKMAIRLEKAFGVDMEELMRLQSNYDISCARLFKSQINVKRYPRYIESDKQPRLI